MSFKELFTKMNKLHRSLDKRSRVCLEMVGEKFVLKEYYYDNDNDLGEGGTPEEAVQKYLEKLINLVNIEEKISQKKRELAELERMREHISDSSPEYSDDSNSGYCTCSDCTPMR